ncbi:hypothetical protein HT136_03325 [Novosphingobium profundi]|uniref:hypothetical protein n=1 Tax=Novosphingobium profundi TaxID=1774954 RepID=UPI001BDAE659|nr:hypothetical protein [Novosphingobium profundi]MBT0667396.1 hypothetical protein [Novosphingobium profundi]
MSRARRSFKLRLSSAGVDVLIDSHCHLIRVTRTLIAWGTTLHVAVEHLSTVPTREIVARLKAQSLERLGGAEEHHVGASHRLREIATDIAERVQHDAPGARPPHLGAIYLLALQQVTEADKTALLLAFDRVLQAGARAPARRE